MRDGRFLGLISTGRRRRRGMDRGDEGFVEFLSIRHVVVVVLCHNRAVCYYSMLLMIHHFH
jgi:hypothetical protein